MKSKENLMKELFATLHELQKGCPTERLKEYLQHKLEFLYDTLGEDVPEEYWEQIEDACKL